MKEVKCAADPLKRGTAPLIFERKIRGPPVDHELGGYFFTKFLSVPHHFLLTFLLTFFFNLLVI